MKSLRLTLPAALAFLGTVSCVPPRSDEAIAKELASLKNEVAQLRQQVTHLNAAQTQRFRIEMRQGVRADIYLLDTATGRVWREYNDPKKNMMWWKESPKEDDAGEIFKAATDSKQ